MKEVRASVWRPSEVSVASRYAGSLEVGKRTELEGFSEGLVGTKRSAVSARVPKKVYGSRGDGGGERRPGEVELK